MLDLRPENLRAAFWKLKKEIEATEAEAKPHRDRIGSIWAQAEEEVAIQDAKVKEIEAGLFEKKNQLSALCKLLKNKVGEPPQE